MKIEEMLARCEKAEAKEADMGISTRLLRKLIAVAEALRAIQNHPLMRDTINDPAFGVAPGSLWKLHKDGANALAALEAD